jgi:hypothetical protein
MADDIYPENSRLDGYYHVDRDADWFYVDAELMSTISLGPATDGEPSDVWCDWFVCNNHVDYYRDILVGLYSGLVL